ncbi:MAG: MMPL family transporter [Lentisphaerae bacterium]|nr:MMPL family transporter [Lentisphaerota bacterium]
MPLGKVDSLVARAVRPLTIWAVNHPRWTLTLAVLLTLAFGSQFARMKIDTDPENMLEAKQSDRVFYNKVKSDFGIHDLIVLGITDEDSIWRRETLEKIKQIAAEIAAIRGVIAADMVSLATTDNVKARDGVLDVHPPLASVPATSEAIAELRREIAANRFLHEKLASADGRGTAIYVPIERKDQAHRISREMETIVRGHLLPGQRFYLAGLPVAEDTFGFEMFLQMGVTAPIAFMAILGLVYLLLRRVGFLMPISLTIMFAIMWAMGLLIGTGHTVHIMSSMIPVFLMPIAILDNIHLLSEFSDRYRTAGDRRATLLAVMDDLYQPCFFTSITTAVGFVSLALSSIPPVRVFGAFVAFGVMAAWLFSMMVVPACIMLMNEERLRSWAAARSTKSSALDRVLAPLGRGVFRRAPLMILAFAVLLAAGLLGIRRIQVNDNPVKWFREGHRMRVADRAMNQLFGGTYMANLVIDGGAPDAIKQPAVLRYIDELQAALEADPIVGKTSSIADILKRTNFVLHDERSEFDVVPASAEASGQLLFLVQSSGDPNDLDNFVTADAAQANIWVQMKGGDNLQMARVENLVKDFQRRQPPPQGVKVRWSGLTYINKVWQGIMVSGMLQAVLSSFVWVLLLMIIELRSLTLGLFSMLPVSVAIVGAYGVVGWLGKDYDMPVAVCSALALGQGIDFAIHFMERFRQGFVSCGVAAEANRLYFAGPARANLRSAIVIILGFLPMAGSTLTPYVTVGLFFALLMTFSALATLALLPALMRFAARWTLGRKS